jgi:hypothetical protein
MGRSSVGGCIWWVRLQGRNVTRFSITTHQPIILDFRVSEDINVLEISVGGHCGRSQFPTATPHTPSYQLGSKGINSVIFLNTSTSEIFRTRQWCIHVPHFGPCTSIASCRIKLCSIQQVQQAIFSSDIVVSLFCHIRPQTQETWAISSCCSDDILKSTTNTEQCKNENSENRTTPFT